MQVRRKHKATTMKYLPRAMLEALKKEIAIPRFLNGDGGWNVEYSMEGTTLVLRMDTSKTGPMTRSGKSWTVASSRGPFWLKSLGLPNMFIMAVLSRAIPAEQKIVRSPEIDNILEQKEMPGLYYKLTPEGIFDEELKEKAANDARKVRKVGGQAKKD